MIKITKTNKPNVILDESLATDAKIEKDIKQTTEFGEGEVLKSVEKCEQNALETEKELEKTAEPVLDITAKEHKDEVFGKLEEQLNEGIYVVDRKELAKYIKECYENKLSFSVKRSVKEGFRYCLTKGLNEALDEETKGDAIDELVTGGTCKNRAEAEEYLAKADKEEKPFEEPAEEPVEESLGVKFANFYKDAENADMSVFENLVEKYNPSLDEDIDVIVDSMSTEDKNLLFETYLNKKEEVLTEAAETNSQKVLRTLKELGADMNTGVEAEECLKEEFEKVIAFIDCSGSWDERLVRVCEKRAFDEEHANEIRYFSDHIYAKPDEAFLGQGTQAGPEIIAFAKANPEAKIVIYTDDDMMYQDGEALFDGSIPNIKLIRIDLGESLKEAKNDEEEIKVICWPDYDKSIARKECIHCLHCVDIDPEQAVECLADGEGGADVKLKDGSFKTIWFSNGQWGTSDLKPEDYEKTRESMLEESLTEAKEDKKETEEVEEEPAKEEPAKEEETAEPEAEPEVKVEIDVEEPKELPASADDDIDFTFFEPLDSTLEDEITVDEPVDLEAKYNAGDLDYEDMVDSISFVTADEDNPTEENKAFNFDIYKTEDGKYVAFGNDTPFGPADDVEELKNQIRDFMSDSEFTVTEEEETFNVVKDESNFTDDFGDDETELALDAEPEAEEEIVDVKETPTKEEIAGLEDGALPEEEPEEEKVEDEEIYDEDESDLDLASFDR